MTNENEYAVELLRQFLRIDTSNPPGNEEQAMLFLEGVLKEAGIHSEIYLAAPKRANLLARIKGKNEGKPIILLSHVDVVVAKEDGWEADPFGGEIKDGFIYGRGTIDMKGQTICQLLAFIALKKEGIVPERDIIFLATCDEEVGGKNGVEYMLKEVPELREASFVLSEGGFVVEDNGVINAQVSVAEKKLAQFYIKAHGPGGHGSTPCQNTANEKVIRAAHRIISHKWPFRATSVVSAYMKGIFKGMKGKGYRFTTLKETLKREGFRRFVENDPMYNALLRTTVTPTILQAGEKVNVIPDESHAFFDARLLPTENYERFMATIRRIAGKDVEVVPVSGSNTEPAPSGYNSRYFKGISGVAKGLHGPIPVLPFVTRGATDLRYFRDLGITAYGFCPITLPKDEYLRMHGVNERISIDNVRAGLEGTTKIVLFLATLA
jgi:acetylornithine deacetylase/succinyl-diaminopimelate desuccinylase-like protein